jgi:hypothetical protein
MTTPVKQKKHLELALILLCAGLALSPFLFRLGFSDTYDWALHLRWSNAFYQALQQGQMYPRWVAEANQGWGAPIFIFYPPLSYYLISFLRWIGFDAVHAIKFFYLLAHMGFAVSMYTSIRRLGHARMAFVLTLFALVAPQIMLIAYRWNMPASSLALIWVPLLISLAIKPCTQASQHVLFCGVAFAGLMLSHMPSAVQMAALLGGVWLWRIISHPDKKWFYTQSVLGYLLGLGLSAIYWLPAIGALPEVHHESLIQGVLNWRLNFLYHFTEHSKLWFQADYIYLMLINSLLLGIVLLARYTRQVIDKKNEHSTQRSDATILGALMVFCFVMMTPLSTPLYALLTPFQYLQFPWRWQPFFLVTATLYISCFCIDGFKAIPYLLRTIFGIVIVLWLLCSWGLIQNQSFTFLPATHWTDGADVAWAQSGPMRDTLEHRPKTLGDRWMRSFSDEGFAGNWSSSPNAQMHLQRNEQHHQTWWAHSYSGGHVRIKRLCFSGWRAYFQQKPLPLHCDKSGAWFELDLPPGDGQLQLRFEPTLTQKYATAASMLSLMLLGWLAFRHRISKKN